MMFHNNKRRRRQGGNPYEDFDNHDYITILVETFYNCDLEGRVDQGEEGTQVFSVSIPLVVRHHRARPGGNSLAVGQVCAGSLDLALNILNHLYPPGSDGEEPVRCRGVNLASATAYRHYRQFTNDFLVPLDPKGGRIPVARIRSWVANRRAHDQHR